MTEDSNKFWDVMSSTYDGVVDETIGKGLRPTVRDRLAGEVRLGRVVEFGCGTGYFTEALARVADSVVATDLSDGMLARARERLVDFHNVTLQNENCMRTTLPGESFDTVFLALVLNLVPDPSRALSEAWRILRPGGMLLVANPDWGFLSRDQVVKSAGRLLVNYRQALDTTAQPVENMGEDRLRALVEAAGFRIVGLELIRDVSDPSNSTMEYMRAVKSNDGTPNGAFPRIVTEVSSAGIAISVKSLVKNYGHFTAVCNVSFTVSRGEIFALLGPNGAGKTTIVEILECLKSPTRGYVNILGQEILTGDAMGNVMMGSDLNQSLIKEKIGVLPQHFKGFDLLTVYENVDYFARMYSKHASVDDMIEAFDLADKRNVLFRNLSGGLKQRVGIVVALINDPEIVFLDEPTAGLDPRSRREVWDAVKDLKARSKTVFLTTHYMDEAQNLADRVCVIHKGSIVAEGSPEDLIDRYGQGNKLIIRGCSAEARDLLIAALSGCEADSPDLVTKLSDVDGMASLTKAVAILEAGSFACEELFIKKPTLEDVFLNLTGEKLAKGER